MVYKADVPVTRMMSNAYIVEIAVEDGDSHADDEEPQEMPTMPETHMLHLLRIKAECSDGDEESMQCIEQPEKTFWHQMQMRNRRASCSSFVTITPLSRKLPCVYSRVFVFSTASYFRDAATNFRHFS